jgi:3-hydroxybutyryl-CoA dehydrogenase
MASFMYSHIPQVVGVVGAGQMGSGIAQVLAAKGLDVVISDRSAGKGASAAHEGDI